LRGVRGAAADPYELSQTFGMREGLLASYPITLDGEVAAGAPT
jgi:hypothetical protein